MMRAQPHPTLPALLVVVGVVLLIYMVVVESEPGALPLLMIMLGVGWWVIGRGRRSNRGERSG